MNDSQSKTAGSEVAKALILAEAAEIAMGGWHSVEKARAFACSVSDYLLSTQAGALQAVEWPTMPPNKGQSSVLFEDGYAEGWAKCLSACKGAATATQPTAGNEKAVAAADGGHSQLQALHNELYRAQRTESVEVLMDSIGKARLLLARYRDLLAAAPAAEAVARYQFTDGTCTLKKDVLDAINVYAGSRPEEDADEPESWESWFEAAFDLCSARVHDIFDEHARRDASSKQEVSHG